MLSFGPFPPSRTKFVARIIVPLAFFGVLVSRSAHADVQNSRVEGDWIAADQSALRIAPCGGDLCIRITRLPPAVPYTTDGLNPDAQLRSRPLCGLRIGSGFHATGTGSAEGGSLYDPKSGKTYHGSMTVEGDRLQLRGYVGIKLFGRTETWVRAKSPVTTCAKSAEAL